MDEAFRQAFDHIYALQGQQAPQGSTPQGLQVASGLLLTPGPKGVPLVSLAPSGVVAGTFALAKLTALGTNGSITIDQFGRVTAFTAAT